MALVLALASAAAGATEVALTGTFGSTAAILSIDGGAPKTVKEGLPKAEAEALKAKFEEVGAQVELQ